MPAQLQHVDRLLYMAYGLSRAPSSVLAPSSDALVSNSEHCYY